MSRTDARQHSTPNASHTQRLPCFETPRDSPPAGWLRKAAAGCAQSKGFADGNGRLARLLATVPLVASGQPVVDIPAEARDRYMAALARWQFACGAPLPNKPLFPKESELKDFIALCKSSQVNAEPAKPTPKKKTAARAHNSTQRSKK